MPTPSKGPRLGSGPSHERLLLRTLAEQLSHAKKGDLPARRMVMAQISNKSVVHTLLTEIGPRFATREGGYTRITKVGPRKGDNAPMAVIELLTEKDN